MLEPKNITHPVGTDSLIASPTSKTPSWPLSKVICFIQSKVFLEVKHLRMSNITQVSQRCLFVMCFCRQKLECVTRYQSSRHNGHHQNYTAVSFGTLCILVSYVFMHCITLSLCMRVWLLHEHYVRAFVYFTACSMRKTTWTEPNRSKRGEHQVQKRRGAVLCESCPLLWRMVQHPGDEPMKQQGSGTTTQPSNITSLH